MLNDRDERIIQQLHIIALMLGRSRKQADTHPVMSKRYSERTIQLIKELMEFVEPTGRVDATKHSA